MRSESARVSDPGSDSCEVPMVRQWWTCRIPAYIMLDVILNFYCQFAISSVIVQPMQTLSGRKQREQ
jgi:hypothetical protein